MQDESGQIRALRVLPGLSVKRETLRGLLEPLLWMLAGMVLDMGIRAVWIRSALHLPNWGGLFLDLTGVMVVGMARDRTTALGVVVLNQIFRMAYGEISNAFIPVEIAGALFWGWMSLRRLVVLEWRKPALFLRTFLLAGVGGGVVCALAAWLNNLILRGQWDFMPVQQRLYQRFDPLALLRAIPVEIGLSVWDKCVTAVLAMGVLAALYSARGRFPVLSFSLTKTMRHYSSTVAATFLVVTAWGLFLGVRILSDLLTAPMAIDFLLFRQTLVVNASYLAITAILTGFLVRWRRTSLNRLNFVLSWASITLAALLFFLSGLYLVANVLSWSSYRAVWAVERQAFQMLAMDPSQTLPEGMSLVFLGEAEATALRRAAFLPAWKVARSITWGDLDRVVAEAFPSRGAGKGSDVEGYLQTPAGLQLAVLRENGPGNRGPALICEEAPWIFSHGYRDRLTPTLTAFFALFALMALIMALLGRQMMNTAGEAALGRQARALAEKIRGRNRRLEHLQVELEGAVAQREARIRELASLAEVGKAVGVLAHEIRNPIGTIQMAFGNLLDTLEPDDHTDLAEQVAIIDRQLRHMNMLTQSVLAFSRGTAEVHVRKRCLASAILDNCQSLFGPTAARMGVELLVSPVTEDALVSARENEVIQILQNLLLNAIEAVAECEPPPPARTVSLMAHEESGEVLFEVSDTGQGLAAGDREKIFDLFYSNKTEGTGLGLFIARELARMLHGDLEVESEEGHGCRFRLRLPAAD